MDVDVKHHVYLLTVVALLRLLVDCIVTVSTAVSQLFACILVTCVSTCYRITMNALFFLRRPGAADGTQQRYNN